MELASPFDQALLEHGPAAFFVLDAQGRVRMDADRTRECWMLAVPPPECEIGRAHV